MSREIIAEALAHLIDDFIQIQKSFLVNFKKIDVMGANYVTIKGTKIPIGAQFKNILIEKIKL